MQLFIHYAAHFVQLFAVILAYVGKLTLHAAAYLLHTLRVFKGECFEPLFLIEHIALIFVQQRFAHGIYAAARIFAHLRAQCALFIQHIPLQAVYLPRGVPAAADKQYYKRKISYANYQHGYKQRLCHILSPPPMRR